MITITLLCENWYFKFGSFCWRAFYYTGVKVIHFCAFCRSKKPNVQAIFRMSKTRRLPAVGPGPFEKWPAKSNLIFKLLLNRPATLNPSFLKQTGISWWLIPRPVYPEVCGCLQECPGTIRCNDLPPEADIDPRCCAVLWALHWHCHHQEIRSLWGHLGRWGLGLGGFTYFKTAFWRKFAVKSWEMDSRDISVT